MTTGKVFQAITLLVALCTAIVANIGLLEGKVPAQVLSWLLFVTTILASALPSLLMTLNPEKTTKSLKGGTSLCVFLALGIVGCAASFEESKLAGLDPQARAAAASPSARCMSLDSAHRTWGGLGKGAAVLAGAEGLATWPVEDEGAKIGLAIGAGVTAAVAATAVYVSEDYAATWTRECSQ